MIRRLIILLLIVGANGQNWGAGIDIGITENFNVIESGFSFKKNNSISLYGVLGMPTMMAGLSWQQHFHQNGYNFSLGIGRYYNGDGYGEKCAKTSLVYQWKLCDITDKSMQVNIFLKSGLMVFYDGVPKTIYPIPIISIGYSVH